MMAERVAEENAENSKAGYRDCKATLEGDQGKVRMDKVTKSSENVFAD